MTPIMKLALNVASLIFLAAVAVVFFVFLHGFYAGITS